MPFDFAKQLLRGGKVFRFVPDFHLSPQAAVQ